MNESRNPYDPVIASIEECLRDFEEGGSSKLERLDHATEVELRFEICAGKGVTYDVALVRLARNLLDHPVYGKAIQKALEPHLHRGDIN